MFTGIIEELGSIASIDKKEIGARITINADLVTEDSADGDSIAVNGVCLTAINLSPGSFSADVSEETLTRSTLGRLKQGMAVNLERAVTPSTRLGGHLVQGHVDQTGIFLKAISEGDFWSIRISYPLEIGQYLVYKGSISVEGISLTISGLTEHYFDIAVIPKTWTATNLSRLTPGEPVNLEADVIAKYVERIMEFKKGDAAGISAEKLKNLGF